MNALLSGLPANVQIKRGILGWFSSSFDAAAFLNSLKATHEQAIQKWSERKVLAQQNPAPFLLGPAVDPLEAIRVSQLHERKILGEGGQATILDGGADVQHPALKKHFAIKTYDKEINILVPSVDDAGQRHGTHVAGIVSQVAPACRLEAYVSGPRLMGANNGKIVNCSQIEAFTLPGALLAKLQLPWLDSFISYSSCIAEDTQKLSEGGLLIKSNSNGYCVYDDCSFCQKEAVGYDHMEERTIRVANLGRDGISLYPSSTLPGERYADHTVCAIGTDIRSTLPGNSYGNMSGCSMATPFVTGVATLLSGAFPELKPSEIRQCILDGATPILLDENNKPFLVSHPDDLSRYPAEQVQRSRRFFGRGRVDAERSYALAEALALSKI